MFELSNIRIEENGDSVLLKSDFNSDYFGKDTIWFSLNKASDCKFQADRYDCFLVALLYPAMILNEDMIINGKVSEKLLFNINNYIKHFIRLYSKTKNDIKINCTETTNEVYKESVHIGTGFSGGVDSLCTIYDHLEIEKNKNYKIDTLMFFNTGSHGVYSSKITESKFYDRYYYLKEFSPLPFYALNSNIHKFHEFIVDSHQKTVTFTNVAGILSLQNYFSKYYVASSLSYEETLDYGKKRLNICTESFEPILLPLLSTENITIIPDGQQYNRVEKTIKILNYELARKSLNVCVSHKVSNSKNCSSCTKCLRTLYTLESIDKLDNFASLFDLKTYKKNIFLFKCKQRVLYKRNPFAKENIDLARKNRKYVPSFILSVIICIPKIIQKLMEKIFKK